MVNRKLDHGEDEKAELPFWTSGIVIVGECRVHGQCSMDHPATKTWAEKPK